MESEELGRTLFLTSSYLVSAQEQRELEWQDAEDLKNLTFLSPDFIEAISVLERNSDGACSKVCAAQTSEYVEMANLQM